MPETINARIPPATGAGNTHRDVIPRPARTPRLGFVGVGWIGRNRLDAIAASGAGEVAAISDVSAHTMAQTAAAYPNAEHTTRFDELLSMDLDGLVIATPNALHAEQAIAAFESGLAVFCQKPIARTAPETLAVIDAARRADRLLGVDLSYRCTTGMRAIHALVEAGALGSIYAVESVFHNAYGPDKPWFYDAAAAGGGCLLDLGIHLVDLSLWCLGFPEVKAAHGTLLNKSGTGFTPGSGVEDYASGVIELATGASIQLNCSWRAPAGCDAEIGLTLFGTKGGARFRNVNGSFYDFVAERFDTDRSRQLLASPPDAWGGRAAVAWAERLGSSPQFDHAVEHLAEVAETLDRLYGR